MSSSKAPSNLTEEQQAKIALNKRKAQEILRRKRPSGQQTFSSAPKSKRPALQAAREDLGEKVGCKESTVEHKKSHFPFSKTPQSNVHPPLVQGNLQSYGDHTVHGCGGLGGGWGQDGGGLE